MRKLNWMILLAAMTVISTQVNAAQERVGDFNLIDHKGTAHQLSKYGYLKALVVISAANTCSVSQSMYTEYKILRTKRDDSEIGFVMLNASPQDNFESIRNFDASYNVDMPILVDDTQLVAESLGITKAGEVVVIDPTTRIVLYRGPMDTPGRGAANPGTTFLKDVLDAVAAGTTRDMETVVVDFEATPDCMLEFPTKLAHQEQVPDYETQVAPILIERCVVCHVEGGIGPFAMNSHQMVQGWSPMIKEVLMTKRMPPTQVDPSIRHFENARNLPVEELQTLVHWINAGAPRE